MIEHIHEQKVDYTVTKHGRTYVEYEEVKIYPCPECMSTNIIDIEKALNDPEQRDFEYDGDGEAQYICNECGCEFDVTDGIVLTKTGKRLESFFDAASGVCIILAAIAFFAGLFAVLFTEVLKFLLIAVITTVVLVGLGALFGKLYEKI